MKNSNLFEALSQKIEISVIDLVQVKKRPLLLFKLLSIISSRNCKFVIGVAGTKTRKRFCRILFYLNRKAMNQSLLIVMGGSASQDIAKDKSYQRYVKAFKKVYVETKKMESVLNCVGVMNTGIFPNGRFRPTNNQVLGSHSFFSCVFFSFITPVRGAAVVIDTAKRLPEINFHFYGEIDETYKDTFLKSVGATNNITYEGVFRGSEEEKYLLLGNFDAMLLPTMWYAEGIPGIIVESKIAGVIPIVSNQNYNSELVRDLIDGIVLPEVSSDELLKAVTRLKDDPELCCQLKKASKESANSYFIENYVDDIIEELSIEQDSVKGIAK